MTERHSTGTKIITGEGFDKEKPVECEICSTKYLNYRSFHTHCNRFHRGFTIDLRVVETDGESSGGPFTFEEDENYEDEFIVKDRRLSSATFSNQHAVASASNILVGIKRSGDYSASGSVSPVNLGQRSAVESPLNLHVQRQEVQEVRQAAPKPNVDRLGIDNFIRSFSAVESQMMKMAAVKVEDFAGLDEQRFNRKIEEVQEGTFQLEQTVAKFFEEKKKLDDKMASVQRDVSGAVEVMQTNIGKMMYAAFANKKRKRSDGDKQPIVQD